MLFGGFARRCCAGSLPLASFLHKTHNLQIVPSIWYAKNEFSYSLVGRIFHCEGEQKMGKIDATVPDKIAIADLRYWGPLCHQDGNWRSLRLFMKNSFEHVASFPDSV
jgi:hypothetical protein